MKTIKRARGLTEEGRRALARYLAENLKDAYLQTLLAAWEDDVNWDGNHGDEVGHMEISSYYSKTGNPVCLTFRDEEVEIVEEELDDDEA